MRLLIILALIFCTVSEQSAITLDCECTEYSAPYPMTSFTCWGRPDGYYADVEVDCVLFHYCQTFHFPSGLNETIKWDFACPDSTVFNQRLLSCTPPGISFDCQESSNFFEVAQSSTTLSDSLIEDISTTTENSFSTDYEHMIEEATTDSSININEESANSLSHVSDIKNISASSEVNFPITESILNKNKCFFNICNSSLHNPLDLNNASYNKASVLLPLNLNNGSSILLTILQPTSFSNFKGVDNNS